METLINEAQKSGNYEVIFDASNLSSGIYFCFLEIKSPLNNTKYFTDSIKMLLIK